MSHFRCIACWHLFDDQSGPHNCPKCQSNQVVWIDCGRRFYSVCKDHGPLPRASTHCPICSKQAFYEGWEVIYL